MNRYLNVFFSLTVSFAAAQAQSVTTLNAVNHTTDPATTENAPRKTKAAVEAPFYIKVYGLYALLTPGSQISYSNSQSQTGMATAFKTNSTGLGAGPRAGVGIGTIVSDFINLGIDADILFGTPIKTDNNTVGSNNSYTYTGTTTTNLKVISVIPNITFKALSRPSYYIYNRLGLVGGVVTEYKTVQNSLYKPTTGASTIYEYASDYTKNSLAIGYQAALGIQFRLGQSLRGFAEIVAYNQSFKPQELQNTNTSTKGTVVTKTVNTTQYKSQGDYVTTDPGQQPNYNVAMNSVSVGVGILFRF